MDGLKKFFRTLKRLHFWIICPLVIILGLAGWWMTIGKLKDETKKNRSEIDQKFTSTESLARESIHPNDKVASGMDKLIEGRLSEVAAAWQEKWDQQTRDGGVLTWPDFDWDESTKREFLAKVRGKRPIEKEVPFPLPPENDLRKYLRELYRDYIQDELPKLAEMIGAVWLPAETGGGGRTAPPGMSADEAIVGWDGVNQKELQDAHFNWEQTGSFQRGAVRSQSAPTMLEILYAQEDLWVLRAIMQVIQRANENATARFNAAVKEIEWIRIGKKAIPSAGRITRVTGADAGDMMGGDPMGDPRTQEMPGAFEDYSRDEMGGMDGMGLGGAGATGPDPGEGRYVDKDYKKLDEGKLRTVMQSTESVAPEDAYLVVAKRVPVRMRLKVDQRKLHQLLVECANSELTIEVRELRVNPADSTSSSYTRRPTSDEFEGRTKQAIEQTSSYDLTVEIYGIVYLYNPVDRSILGEETGTGEEDAGDVPADEGDVASLDAMRTRRLTNSM